MIYIIGPGHGGPGIVANTWLRRHLQRGSTRTWPQRRGRDEKALQTVFPFPAEFRAMSRARNNPVRFTKAANWATPSAMLTARPFDNPDLIVAAVVGGRPESGRPGPLGNVVAIRTKFLNPANRWGKSLPILHLNGYKIANPTVVWHAIQSRRTGSNFSAVTAIHPSLVEGQRAE